MTYRIEISEDDYERGRRTFAGWDKVRDQIAGLTALRAAARGDRPEGEA